MTYLLVDFAKVNLKILKKLQNKEKIYLDKANKFQKASNLKIAPTPTRFDIHDAVTHTLIPKKLSKRFGVKSESIPEDFLPLSRLGQTKKQKDDVNNSIEMIAAGIEAVKLPAHQKDSFYHMGRSVRKRSMTPEDKLAKLRYDDVSEILKGKTPTDKDVQKIRKNLKNIGVVEKRGTGVYPPKIQQPQKIRGQKPLPQTVEEKRQTLETKYKRKALQAKYT